ncbi:hypothetical protein ACFVHB_36445 [Kitasatospora sp. NPDC127111]|uniref:hypothetical protein n=1 Tax=Kitasatospora sp. NPDC127111 TaxID=3345363 RepID=UPI00362DEC53
MAWSLSVRRPAALAAVLAVSVLAGAAPARAAGAIEHFDVTETETYTAPLEGCLPPDLLGTVTLTEHSTGWVVSNGPAVVITGTNVVDFHMDLPDGRYVQSGLDRDDFQVVLRLPYDTVSNVSTQDERTIHAADGRVIGTLTIHEEHQVVYRDLNTNGEPDPGEVTVERHEFRLTCGTP